MSNPLVMTEDEALELLAFLVTSARTQVDEPTDYAPLRLLTAAGRLSDFIMKRVSPETQQWLSGFLAQIPWTQTRISDPKGYDAQLDALCAAVASHLVTHFKLAGGSS